MIKKVNPRIRKVILIVLIVILIKLLFPLPYQIKDGGSVMYKADLYQVTKYHMISAEEDGGIIGGWNIQIFGIEVYENTYPLKE